MIRCSALCRAGQCGAVVAWQPASESSLSRREQIPPPYLLRSPLSTSLSTLPPGMAPLLSPFAPLHYSLLSAMGPCHAVSDTKYGQVDTGISVSLSHSVYLGLRKLLG
ncbi:hypothetical protein M758_6G006100 [Ceratodon purpureus]|nr:hypothetical protein M758_6G006100 [Ceratodon purpureus]